MLKIKILAILVLIAVVGGLLYQKHHHDSLKQTAAQTAGTASQAKTEAAQTAQRALDNHCSGDIAGQEVVVSITQQHMWACQGNKAIYDNAVITGMDAYDDSTPTGTYQIFSKLTDQTLKGCDASGCWNDPVSYWMPYQQASGGTIGFHDATWRQPSDFGNILPSSNKGSHGCVEMPLTAAEWLYDWVAVGTAVTIES